MREVPPATEKFDDIPLIHPAREEYVPTRFEREHQQGSPWRGEPREAIGGALPCGVGKTLDAAEVVQKRVARLQSELVQSANIPLDPLDLHLLVGRALLSLRQRVLGEVEPGDPPSVLGQINRVPPGTAADVERATPGCEPDMGAKRT